MIRAFSCRVLSGFRACSARRPIRGRDVIGVETLTDDSIMDQSRHFNDQCDERKPMDRMRTHSSERAPRCILRECSCTNCLTGKGRLGVHQRKLAFSEGFSTTSRNHRFDNPWRQGGVPAASLSQRSGDDRVPPGVCTATRRMMDARKWHVAAERFSRQRQGAC